MITKPSWSGVWQYSWLPWPVRFGERGRRNMNSTDQDIKSWFLSGKPRPTKWSTELSSNKPETLCMHLSPVRHAKWWTMCCFALQWTFPSPQWLKTCPLPPSNKRKWKTSVSTNAPISESESVFIVTSIIYTLHIYGSETPFSIHHDVCDIKNRHIIK